MTCHLAYVVDVEKLDAFAEYARAWVDLIERYGGTHHGYYVAADDPPASGFSFAGLGRAGRRDIAFAMFSFPDVEAYDAYRRDVRTDPACTAAEKILEQTKCFLSYERTFVKRLD